MLPKVIVHTEVSVDGRMDWMQGDNFLYYTLICDWQLDAMLSGSATMLAAYPNPDTEENLAEPLPEKAPELQKLVVVDSRAQIRSWRQIQRSEWWGDVIALCSKMTPQTYIDRLMGMGIDVIVTGEDRVDLREALSALCDRYGVRVVRTDSGGILHGVLFRERLVDEVSVILNPSLVGGTSPRSFYVAPDLPSEEGIIPLKLDSVQQVGDSFVWLRYSVKARV